MISTEQVMWLLEHGADIDGRNDRGWTPLHAASSNGHHLTVQTLVEKGADFNARDQVSGVLKDFGELPEVVL